ncbi:hypothetical protein JCM24511_02489 [Saitozyma sp. JCM 24511]|nr:hypothetical protein JCM24511_02489 [Saitozyma sp. JCM 24511]
MDDRDLPAHLLGEEYHLSGLRPNVNMTLSNNLLPILLFSTPKASSEGDTSAQSQLEVAAPISMSLSFWGGLPEELDCSPCRRMLGNASRSHVDQFLRDQTGPVELTDEFLRNSTLRLLEDITWSVSEQDEHFRNGHYNSLISVEEANLSIDGCPYTTTALILTSREDLYDYLSKRGIVIFRLPEEDGLSTAVVTLSDSSDVLEEEYEVELYQTLERAPLQDHWIVNAVTRMISSMRDPRSDGANQAGN